MTCSRCGEVRFFDPTIHLYDEEAEWSYECSNDECGRLHTFRTTMDEYRDWEARNHIAFRRARIIDTITGDWKGHHTFKWKEGMKLKTLRMARLTLDDGTEHHLEFLGRGLTHDAWRKDKQVYLISRSVKGCEDYSREVFADKMLRPASSPHFPKLTYLGEIGRDRRVYVMPYYEPLLSKHTLAYEQFKFLHLNMEEIRSTTSRKLFNTKGQMNELGYEMSKELAKVTRARYHRLGVALDRLADAAANWGTSYTFEFNRSNLSVSCGILILRDILYNIKCCEARWR